LLSGFWYLLRRGGWGVFHAHDVGATAWLAVAGRYLLGGRCVMKLRAGRPSYERRLASGLARYQLLTLLRLVDRVIVVNSEVEELSRDLGIAPARVVRIPNGVDATFFQPVLTADKLAARERLGLPAEKTIVLFVGRLVPVKGLDSLLQAWGLLPQSVRAGALLVMVGDGEERKRLQELSSSLRVDESIMFAGAQQAVLEYYWCADLFVLPSLREGLSNTLIEAMACGLPVIASNVGGALDVVEDGKNGVLFDAQNVDHLARKLESMIAMKDRWSEMGARARQKVVEYADLQEVVQRMQGLYDQLLQ
jgi:glycosyltransferase involved in cell wall biosynthesis